MQLEVGLLREDTALAGGLALADVNKEVVVESDLRTIHTKICPGLANVPA